MLSEGWGGGRGGPSFWYYACDWRRGEAGGGTVVTAVRWGRRGSIDLNTAWTKNFSLFFKIIFIFL